MACRGKSWCACASCKRPGGSRDLARASSSLAAAVRRDMQDPRARWARLKQLKINARGGLTWHPENGTVRSGADGAGTPVYRIIDPRKVASSRTTIANLGGTCQHGLPCRLCLPYSIAGVGEGPGGKSPCEVRTLSTTAA